MVTYNNDAKLLKLANAGWGARTMGDIAHNLVTRMGSEGTFKTAVWIQNDFHQYNDLFSGFGGEHNIKCSVDKYNESGFPTAIHSKIITVYASKHEGLKDVILCELVVRISSINENVEISIDALNTPKSDDKSTVGFALVSRVYDIVGVKSGGLFSKSSLNVDFNYLVTHIVQSPQIRDLIETELAIFKKEITEDDAHLLSGGNRMVAPLREIKKKIAERKVEETSKDINDAVREKDNA